LVDADNDGLSLVWEQLQGFSDALAADAAQDPDHDGSTNFQEFTRGTQPNNADTDDDGLLDGAEVATLPLVADSDGDSILDGEEVQAGLNPMAADSDGDGAADAWERRVGTSATSGSSTPPTFAAAVGLHFCSEMAPESALSRYDVTGLVPQMNWNNTIQLSQWNATDIAGGTAHIASPNPGVLVNSAGSPTGITVNWSANATSSAGNSGSATGILLDSALWTNSDTVQATVSFQNVPFSSYEVLVYLTSSFDDAEGEITCTPSVGRESRFRLESAAPQKQLLELLYPSTPPYAGSFYRRRANTARFRVNGSSSFTLALSRVSWHEVGIAGVQIVNIQADADGDGMSDAYEVTHRLRPAVNDAGLDPDSDGLTNLGEFQRGTRPDVRDTDGDGLSDAVETGTGVYVSPSNTGSLAVHADSDGDTLSDGEEVHGRTYITSPVVQDTDGDGIGDLAELRQYLSDPTTSAPAAALLPVITTSPRSFDWSLYMQFVWDRQRAHFSDMEWGDRSLVWLGMRNRSAGADGLGVAFRVVRGAMTTLLYSSADGAFSSPGQPGSDIWFSDWDVPPVDIASGLGFSKRGKLDISSRLRVRVEGTSTGAANAWNMTFSIYNLDTNQIVVSQTYNGCTLSPTVHNGSVVWEDEDYVASRLYQQLFAGTQLHYLAGPTAPSVETLPSMTAYRDTDNDGMPDVWEASHNFNPNVAADATLDADGDTLLNYREYELGTHPHLADTDGDGVRDDFEVLARSNPLVTASRPSFWNGLPSGASGEDLNGNGISDPVELVTGRFDLLGAGDADGDGLTNAEEAIAGTDLLNPHSRLWVDQFRTGNDLTVCWPLLPHKSHQLLQSGDLVAWSPVPGSPVPVAGETRFTIPGSLAGPQRFYRAAVNDLDTDGDGVTDWAERNVLQSDPSLASSLRSGVSLDTDANGTPESWLSGDYTALVEQLQGANASGGFSGGSVAATSISRPQAARFLTQASFGPTLEEIDRVQELGYDAWITDQVNQPATHHADYARAILADLAGAQVDLSYSYGENKDVLFGNNVSTGFARAAIGGSDQLRQRVAFALSQILVVSRRDAALENQVLGLADYYDLFVDHAFGNYQDLLLEVTLHPCMGRYLSHVGNQKADPSINRYPDENYAREVMQLFTIGLWELNPDGTRKTLPSGVNIPTYGNTEITQLARVLTGLWFGQHPWGQGGWSTNDYATPMTMHAELHDFGSKTLLGGFTLPAREPTVGSGMQDIGDAIRHLFEHPNTGPFVCKQLIQFLVTDNPSPAYVQRVAAMFANNGSGVRGDMKAVVRSVLLDLEARGPVRSSSFGRLKEPVMRTMAMARAFGMKEEPKLLWWSWNEFYDNARQEPLYSPSVFNFYRPDYKAPGAMTAAQKYSPVFQITDSYSAIAFPNKLWEMLNDGFRNWGYYQFPFHFSREVAMAADPDALVDHMNLLFCAGQMSLNSRNLIKTAIQTLPSTTPEARVRVAAYLALICPEGAVMK
jgi:uncharacterized protein (DUF1800 family)